MCLSCQATFETQRSRRTRNCINLAAQFLFPGVETKMPCTRCFRCNLACIMSEYSSCCTECIEISLACDGTFVTSSLSRLAAQQKKLEAEEADTDEALLTLQTQLSIVLSRLACLRRMKKVIKEKSSEVFCRGMRELDEEDAVSLIAHEEQVVVSYMQSLGIPNAVDWSTFGFGNKFDELGTLVETEDTARERRSP